MYDYSPFTFEEFKQAVLESPFNELWLYPWSNKSPFITILSKNEDEIEYKVTPESENRFGWLTLYSKLKMYLTPSAHGEGIIMK